MARNVKGGLIQLANPINDESKPVKEIQAAAYEAHLVVEQHGLQILRPGVQAVSLGSSAFMGSSRRRDWRP